MNVVDVLVTIIVVTILVTIVLGVVTYIAYKLRLARRPRGADEEVGPPGYFEAHEPPSGGGAPASVGAEAEGSAGRPSRKARARPESPTEASEPPMEAGPPENERGA